MNPQYRRALVAFAVSTVGNIALLSTAWYHPDQHSQWFKNTVDALYSPGTGFAHMLIPTGHDFPYLVGVPLISISFSIVLYGVWAWVLLSLPSWWRSRS
jgi:hypothetical protein